MKYLKQNGSYGLSETVKNQEGMDVTSSLDVLLLRDYPEFVKRMESSHGSARSLNIDSQFSLFPDIQKEDSKLHYAKSGVMKGLKDLLDWKYSVVESDFSYNHADVLVIPVTHSRSGNTFYDVVQHTKTTEDEYQNNRGIFREHKKVRFDLNELTPKNDWNDPNYWDNTAILYALGFNYKRIQFSTVHRFLQQLFYEKENEILPFSEKKLLGEARENAFKEIYDKLAELKNKSR